MVQLFENGVWLGDNLPEMLGYFQLKEIIANTNTDSFEKNLETIKYAFIKRICAKDTKPEAIKIICCCLSKITDEEFANEVARTTNKRSNFRVLVEPFINDKGTEVMNHLDTFFSRFEKDAENELFKLIKQNRNEPVASCNSFATVTGKQPLAEPSSRMPIAGCSHTPNDNEQTQKSGVISRKLIMEVDDNENGIRQSW